MKLHIANLGAVKEATIDLSKKLTVFCGPNGTGKTWVAYVVHGLLAEQNSIYNGPVPDIDALNSEGQIEIEIPPAVAYSELQTTVNDLPKNIQQMLPVPVDKQQELFGNFKIKTVESAESFAKRFYKEEITTTVDVFAGILIELLKPANSTAITLKQPFGGLHLPLWKTFMSRIMSNIARSLATYPTVSSTILPVERSSVFTFNKELGLQQQALVERLLQNNEDSGSAKELSTFLNGRKTRYPKAVRDALIIADDISNISKTASPYYDFGVEVEQNLLQGKVGIGSDGEVSFSPNNAAGKSFSFQLSSSAVKTLSSLIVYLKHQAKPNDLLIIDEPELNLHPNNQILLARVFARMINQGMRLLISTHSDYIVRELNNLIMLSGDEPALKKVAHELGYRNDERIDKSDIGVYLFRFQEDGGQVVVEPVEVADNGFEIATIEHTIKDLNRVSEELYYTMKYGEQVNGDSTGH